MTENAEPKPLVLTAGEPAGIGPDLCVALAQSPLARKVVVIADPDLLAARAEKLSLPLSIIAPDAAHAAGTLRVLPQKLPRPVVLGVADPANAAALLDALRTATTGCLNGSFAALVTAPVQKSSIIEAGFRFSGHTEFLAELTGASTPVMLLVAGTLRVALASTHMPLSAVPAYLTTERIEAVLTVLHRDLSARFRIENPEIRVCGLNPHAGEAGHLGSEDQAVIAPAIERCRRQGMQVTGPVPADTAFTRGTEQPAAVLAMYHDQGLPVVKYAGFGRGVNVTLGLPIVRTSVDHGTALSLAGTGQADPGSLFAAIELAASLAGP